MHKTVSLTVLLNEDASVAEARGTTMGVGEVSGTGSAKRHPNDTPNDKVGFNLAVARALRSLADEYEKRADQEMEPKASLNSWFTDGLITYTTPPPAGTLNRYIVNGV